MTRPKPLPFAPYWAASLISSAIALCIAYLTGDLNPRSVTLVAVAPTVMALMFCAIQTPKIVTGWYLSELASAIVFATVPALAVLFTDSHSLIWPPVLAYAFTVETMRTMLPSLWINGELLDRVS